MTRKRWCLTALATLLTALLAIVAAVVIVDPFEIYHRALFFSPPYESAKQMYAVTGVARSYDYDSVIIGSSVTENCTPSVYDRALGGRFVKLCMNGGLSRDHAQVMDIALRTHAVRRVVYGLDLFAYAVYPTNSKADTPDYLYDDCLLNDVRYWLSGSVLLDEIPRALARPGRPDDDADRDRMYFWDPPSLPGEEALRRRVNLDAPPPGQEDAERALELTALCLERNLLPYLRRYPETTFTVFFPPYSLLYWADAAANGSFASAMAQKRLVIRTLLAEPNVELYDFQAHFDWTADYSLYYDLIHYISSVNDAMAGAMAGGLCRVTDMAQAEERVAALERAVYALFAQEPERSPQ